MREGRRGHYEIEMGTGDLVWVSSGIRAPEFDDNYPYPGEDLMRPEMEKPKGSTERKNT